jgi:hypothetical protein
MQFGGFGSLATAREAWDTPPLHLTGIMLRRNERLERMVSLGHERHRNRFPDRVCKTSVNGLARYSAEDARQVPQAGQCGAASCEYWS